ncbi:CYCP3-1 [Linum perenne]
MGTLSTDTGECLEDSKVYLSLGLKETGKGSACKSPRVLALVSSLLERLVQTNELLAETNEIKDVVTIFHGLRAPAVSIRQYVDRIFKYSCCSPSCFVIAQIYVDRFVQQTNIHLTSLNVHRILITSIMLAAKFVDDAFFNNAYYARVGGITTGELNKLEMKFLFSIDFRLQVNTSTFGRYCCNLEREATDGLHQIERSIQACRIKETWSNNEDSSTCAAPAIAR